MGVNLTYDRPLATIDEATVIPITVLAAEKAGTPAVFAGGAVGTTGNLLAHFKADSDPVGTDVQVLFRLETAISFQGVGASAKPRIVTTVTPILGDGTDGTPVVVSCVHDQTMDAWQTAAGTART